MKGNVMPELTLFEKLIFGVNLVLIGFVLYLLSNFGNSVENCWNKYSTENSVIAHCEKHNG